MTTAHDVFVSHNGLDKPIVERLCRALLEAGLRPWFDKWDLSPGDVWMREIEHVLEHVPAVLVCVGEHGWSAWHEAERLAAVARVTSGSGVVVPVLLPGAPQDVELPMFLRDRQWTDLRRETAWEAEVARLAATLTGQAPRGPWVDEGRARPYRGLQPFTEADAGWMFGREREEAKLLGALRDGQRFITVVGASGSGKSSLVRAGVVPTVRTGGIDGRHRWHALVMRPGQRPCHTLALRLLELQRTIEGTGTDVVGDGDKLTELGARLLTEKSRLSESVDLLLDREDRDDRLLLVIDQFEELFTAGGGRKATKGPHEDEVLEGTKLGPEGAALLRNLVHATNDDGDRVRVIVTVRADFMGECLAVPDLARRMERMHFALPPMEAEQLREAIRRPALRVGYDVEKALADVLVSATQDQPGRLPLLQHTLDLLWEVRDQSRHRMTYPAYDEHIGSLDESVAKRAEEVFATLVAESADHEATIRRVFLRLVHLGEGTGDTRRQLPRSELSEDEAAGAVIYWFVAARLLVTDTYRGGAIDHGEQAVEIAHEALLGRWGRLRRWLNENREALRLRQEVNVAANHWKEHGRPPDDLWHGGRLGRASETLLNGDIDLAANEREFLDASRAARQEQERGLARRQRRLLMGAVGFSGILILALAIALSQYLDAKRFGEEKDEEAKRADHEAENTRRERDAAKAATTAERSARASLSARLPGEELDALELGVRAVGAVDEGEWSSSGVVQGLHDALARARKVVTLPGDGLPLWALAWTSDGTRLATAGGNGTVRLWDGNSGAAIANLEGHTEVVRAVGWNADGTRLATASQDGTARLWNGNTGEPIATLKGHTKSVLAAAWTADGTRLVTTSYDNTARLWNGYTGESVAILQHSTSVLDAAWTTDSTRLATAGQDGVARLWSGTSGEQLAILEGHTSPILAIACSPDGTRLATASGDNTVRLWDGTSGRHIATLTGHTDMVVAVAWAADSTRLATASYDQTARLWEGYTGEPLATLTGHLQSVDSIAWTTDGTRLATGSYDGTARLWNGNTGEPLATLTGHTDWVQAVAWSPDGTRLATASGDGTTKLWTVATGEPLATLMSDTESVDAVAWSPDGSRLATARLDGTGKLWNAASGDLIANIEGHSESKLPRFGGMSMMTMAWAADGTRLATASRDGIAKLWSGTTGELLATLTVPTHEAEAFAWTADTTRLVTVSEDGTARLWDTATGVSLGTLHGKVDGVTTMEWTPNATRLAIGSGDGTVTLWSGTSGSLLSNLQGHTDRVRELAWSADGTRLATASTDDTVRLWNDSGEPLITLDGYDGSVYILAWTSDGARLATAVSDGTVRIWDGSTGEPKATLKGHASALAWTADGTRLAIASRNGTARLWSGSTGELLATLPHTSSVLGLAWTADDTQLLTASQDGTARLWSGSTRGWLVRACEILEGSTGTIDLHQETKEICATTHSTPSVEGTTPSP